MIYNIGSLNIDHVYRVPHFVRPGESLTTRNLLTGPGGKGLNQSIALARAGARVTHIGCIGADGAWLRDLLAAEGVDTTAAGDTFIGYLLAALACGENPRVACKRACAAAALTVSRPGAATAIPHARELQG